MKCLVTTATATATAIAGLVASASVAQLPLELKPGTRIAFIGNAVSDRMRDQATFRSCCIEWNEGQNHGARFSPIDSVLESVVTNYSLASPRPTGQRLLKNWDETEKARMVEVLSIQ